MIPPSTARRTIGSAAASSSAHSRLSCLPKLIIPRHSRETRRPVSPRFTYSIELVDELTGHRVNRDAPHDHAECHERSDPSEILPAVRTEHRVTNEHDAVVQRIDVREPLRPLRKVVEWEERSGEQEERRQHRADDVVEVLD